jgi:hypothetical protein
MERVEIMRFSKWVRFRKKTETPCSKERESLCEPSPNSEDCIQCYERYVLIG